MSVENLNDVMRGYKASCVCALLLAHSAEELIWPVGEDLTGVSVLESVMC